MKTTTALNAFASAAALALTMGLSTAAQAGDFDYGHPELNPQTQRQADTAAPAAQQVQITAQAARRSPQADRSVRGSVSTEESRAMLGEDSGSFWMAQQSAQPNATQLARVDTVKR